MLEKYKDFFRDFRGDTVHPSTLQLLCELGWIDDFLKVPHNEMTTVGANVAGELMTIARFHTPADAVQVRCVHAAMGLPELSRGTW